MSTRSIGFSPCPNDTFIFDALIHHRINGPKVQWDLHMEDVETLNEWALEGRLDITKVSLHAYAHCWKEYQLLQSGAALGFGVGPLLITKKPVQEPLSSDLRVAIPGNYTTAHFLLRWAFPGLQNRVPMVFSTIEEAVLSGAVDAGVIIHENRFTYRDRGLHLVADLGQRWEAATKQAIPLGAIAVRRSLPESEKKDIEHAIAESIQFARDTPDVSASFIRENAQEMDPEVTKQHIDLYVNQYSEGLGSIGRKAISTFLEAATEVGVIHSTPSHIFIS